MSRTVTPQSTQPSTSQVNSTAVPKEKIAKLAYEKWCMRGQPHGSDMKDWLDAEAELRMQQSKQASNQQMRR
jgi:hypothetical protein